MFNDNSNNNEFIQVAYNNADSGENKKKSKKYQNNLWTFKTCPKCEKRNFLATDFVTKGNEPFFNIVSEQFYVEPPVPKYSNIVNQGRKVLLFSDRRQRAAVLARDLTKAADETVMKKALTVAAKELQEWAEANDEEPVLSLLYVFFLKVAYQHNLRFFYGNNEQKLVEDIEKMKEKYEKKGDALKYKRLAERNFSSEPEQYQEHLLRQLCSSFRSLTDSGLCWLEPCDDEDGDTFNDIKEAFEQANVKITIDEFKILFAAWAMEIMTSEYAIGSNISDKIRYNITIYRQRLGVSDKENLPPRIKNLLLQHEYSEEQIKVIAKQLSLFLAQGNASNNFYINTDMVTLRYGAEHEWYKCPRCGGVFPYTIWGKCAHCAKGTPHLMNEEEFKGIAFWREPVLKAISDPRSLMTRINTEEHTAQLSYKDQRVTTWSTTEDFEMRFQNVHVTNDRPVDILSCTTTMEVGIDIGSLTAVGLRNIPPMRENYQQRAGRAGRKSAAISTIVTYTSNQPHDSYYFRNPEKIISGDPRMPWIDVNNHKLVYRHFNVMLVTEFFDNNNGSADMEDIETFFLNRYDSFKSFIKNKNSNDFDIKSLVPMGMAFDFEEYKKHLFYEMDKLYDNVKNFPENYKEDDNSSKKVLYTLLEAGIFPTYSFSKDVVGFYVEDDKGKKIIQKPERSLDMAISEYAPGRIIVINKETYKSGGIYNFHSKFKPDALYHPAKSYFDTKDYFRPLYYCSEQSCNWMGLNETEICPFCGKNSIQQTFLLKPWGFAPIAGRKQIGDDDIGEMTYVENPIYSITPAEDDMIYVKSYRNLRFSKRSDDPLIILNKGAGSKGFVVCKDCGAAVPGDDPVALEKIWKPYNHPYKTYSCQHSNVVNTYLGNQFRTDMVFYEISLPNDKINVEANGLWIIRASATLAEAMTLAGDRLLDIEFNEIKSGYRLRYDREKKITFVDIFLFDSLSSGAGYSSFLAERTEELLEETKNTLNNCPVNCDSACHECLMHYYNQRIHSYLDRFAALDLLNWCKESKLADPLDYNKQNELLNPLNSFAEYTISNDGMKHYIEKNNKKREIIVYPAMWSKDSSMIPNNVVSVSDKMLKCALPQADKIIRKQL